jgi:hypothetical protein
MTDSKNGLLPTLAFAPAGRVLFEHGAAPITAGAVRAAA